MTQRLPAGLADSERPLIEIARIAGDFPSAVARLRDGNDTRVRVWCSNDYLGMGQHRSVLEEMKRAIDRFGAGAGGSRGLVGNNPYHVELERELAALHRKEAALLFNSGYITNDGALSTLASRLDRAVVFSDEQNHASLIDGIRRSGADKRVFRHNDVTHLEQLLAEVDPSRSKLIVLESVYSMSGDVAPLAQIASLARRHGAHTYVDEVHAVGMYGPEGAGLVAREGLTDDFTIIMGTLGKAFGTAGGYVAGPAAIIGALRGACRSFLFTTSLPPAIAAAGLASVRHLRASSVERERLHRNARLLHQLLAERNIAVLSRSSHIVSIGIGSDESCERACAVLAERHGIYVEPITSPLVARGKAMLRLTPSAVHTTREILAFADALDSIWAQLRLPRLDASAHDVRSGGAPSTSGSLSCL